jgi:hypothetical protein
MRFMATPPSGSPSSSDPGRGWNPDRGWRSPTTGRSAAKDSCGGVLERMRVDPREDRQAALSGLLLGASSTLPAKKQALS